MGNAYDRVRYPSLPFAHTHPAALGVFLALFGKRFTPFGASRVLEIGCGEGANLISMALGAPGTEFVGVDLAERPIAVGRETARTCGLANVTLHVEDIARMGASFGRFDYIIAHGVYAWVPAAIRAALMRVVGELLSADGLAMISYNAFPGARIRQALRDMLLSVTSGVDDPEQAIGMAREFLNEQIGVWSEDDPDERAMVAQARRVLARAPEVVFHDELGAHFAPQLLSDVAAAAAAQVELAYLCDALPRMSSEAFFPSAKFDALRSRAAGDWVRFEQYDDFRTIQPFRNSILCRGGGIDRGRDARRLRGLWACGDLEVLPADPNEPGSMFFGFGGAKLSTNDPKLARFLAALAAASPLSVSLDEAAENPALADYVFELFVKQVIRLRTEPFCLTTAPGERPIANPLARFQAANGELMLTTMLHTSEPFEDASLRAFVPLLDGTRGRADLAREIAARDNSPVAIAGNWVSEALTELARAGLMMG